MQIFVVAKLADCQQVTDEPGLKRSRQMPKLKAVERSQAVEENGLCHQKAVSGLACGSQWHCSTRCRRRTNRKTTTSPANMPLGIKSARQQQYFHPGTPSVGAKVQNQHSQNLTRKSHPGLDRRNSSSTDKVALSLCTILLSTTL